MKPKPNIPDDKPVAQDIHQRFLFEHYDIRGEIVSLSASVREVVSRGDYPGPVQDLLGQFMLATCLMSANLKFNGVITVQTRGNGPVPLVMAECTRNHHLRAIARITRPDLIVDNDIRQLVGEGYMTITIQAADNERYQGIVPLEHGKLSDCLTGYFNRSQQLLTRIWLSSDSDGASGLLLQTLPGQLQNIEERHRSWEHVCQLADTLSSEEQLGLSHRDQLHRLFHQDSVRLFDETPRQFACSCSRTRLGNALATLGQAEIMDILATQPHLEVNCEFCNHHYRFQPHEIEELFRSKEPTIH